jgi:NadR type nicotinamide-nucleotide adenylyltransferase
LKKIVIIGPESTGKSVLCEALAAHYNTCYCREYAREYLLKNGTNYTYDDLLAIAKGQLALEDTATINATKNQSMLFIDTDMSVIKVWSEFVFGKCPNFILQEIAKRNYDLYLLCATDLPWAKDTLREYPDIETREKLYRYYKEFVINSGVPWGIVSGTGDTRIQMAIATIDKFIF